MVARRECFESGITARRCGSELTRVHSQFSNYRLKGLAGNGLVKHLPSHDSHEYVTRSCEACHTENPWMHLTKCIRHLWRVQPRLVSYLFLHFLMAQNLFNNGPRKKESHIQHAPRGYGKWDRVMSLATGV
jgi:hypothetical protein